jgi:hypothetical protein
VLIVGVAGIYLVHRVWTYLVFAGDRLDFAAAEWSTTPLTDAEREQFVTNPHLDGPRWIINLVLFAIFLLAAVSRRPTTGSRPGRRPGTGTAGRAAKRYSGSMSRVHVLLSEPC